MTTRRRFFSSCAAVLVAPFLPTQAVQSAASGDAVRSVVRNGFAYLDPRDLKPVRVTLNGAELGRLMVAGLPQVSINGRVIVPPR